MGVNDVNRQWHWGIQIKQKQMILHSTDSGLLQSGHCSDFAVASSVAIPTRITAITTTSTMSIKWSSVLKHMRRGP